MATLDHAVDFFEGLVPGTQPGSYWLTFEKLLSALRRKHPKVCFAGALALNAHGIRRTTEDVGLLVHPESRDALLSALSKRFSLSEDLDTC